MKSLFGLISMQGRIAAPRRLDWRDLQPEAKLHALERVDAVGECETGGRP